MPRVPLASTVVLLAAVAIVAPATAATEGTTDVYRYVGGAYAPRGALSLGGLCTASEVPTPAGVQDAPLVVGGVCSVDVEGASELTLRVHDDVWSRTPGLLEEVPFRFELRGWGPTPLPCARGGTAWGETVLSLGAGCARLDVYLNEAAVVGTITVERR